MELSACIEWLFADEPVFADRIARAAAAGVRCVEFWTWRKRDLDAIRARLEQSEVGLTAVLAETRGQLNDPQTHAEVLEGVSESARAASSLGAHGLIMVAGARVRGVDAADQRRAVADGLRRAGALAAEHGVTLLLEPINKFEDPDCLVNGTLDGLAIIEDVDRPNVRLLYDIYHSAMMGESLEAVLRSRVELVGHIHVADTPARHEPGTGEIDWPAVIEWLSRAGYEGRIGLEYMPSGESAASLDLIAGLVAAA